MQVVNKMSTERNFYMNRSSSLEISYFTILLYIGGFDNILLQMLDLNIV